MSVSCRRETAGPGAFTVCESDCEGKTNSRYDSVPFLSPFLRLECFTEAAYSFTVISVKMGR